MTDRRHIMPMTWLVGRPKNTLTKCQLDWIMSECSSALGIDIGRWKFTDQVYANDAALFTSDAAKWPSALMAFDSAAAAMGLHTSWIKTKVQNLGSRPPASSVDVANERVESGTRFTSWQRPGLQRLLHIGNFAQHWHRINGIWETWQCLETISLKPTNKA